MPGRGCGWGKTGSYLALGCVGHSPNRGDHGEGAGRLVGVLLPRDRVIGERPITAEETEAVLRGWCAGLGWAVLHPIPRLLSQRAPGDPSQLAQPSAPKPLVAPGAEQVGLVWRQACRGLPIPAGHPASACLTSAPGPHSARQTQPCVPRLDLRPFSNHADSVQPSRKRRSLHHLAWGLLGPTQQRPRGSVTESLRSSHPLAAGRPGLWNAGSLGHPSLLSQDNAGMGLPASVPLPSLVHIPAQLIPLQHLGPSAQSKSFGGFQC